jgi:acetyl esterase
MPTVVALRSGWFALGDLDLIDQPCRALANTAGAVVVSVDYALAPESPYPAGLDDAVDALSWAATHIAELGADPTRLFVLGESAGGALAAGATVRLRDAGGPLLGGQILIYPPTDPALDTASWAAHDGIVLDRDSARYYWEQYLDHAAPEAASLACPLRVPDLTGLPPAYVYTAEFDALRDEGEAYALRLEAAGGTDHDPTIRGMTHGMLYMNGVTDATRALTEDLADVVRERTLVV